MAKKPGLDPKLLSRLSSKKAAVREEAERQFEGLGGDRVESLLALLEKEAANRRRRRTIGVVVVVAWLGLMVLLAATHHGENVGSFTSIIGSLGALFAATQLQKDTAKALLRFDDVRAVGGLAEALEFDDKGVAQGAEEALTRLLPRLKASDHTLLTPDQRRCLDRALIKRAKGAFRLAVLAAYEQVGDETSVALVEKIAAAGVRGIRDQRVIARAAEALPTMRERAQLVKAAQTLLRPADAVGDETLLRPASGPPSGPVETLLRPVEEAEDATAASEATERPEEVRAGLSSGRQ